MLKKCPHAMERMIYYVSHPNNEFVKDNPSVVMRALAERYHMRLEYLTYYKDYDTEWGGRPVSLFQMGFHNNYNL